MDKFVVKAVSPFTHTICNMSSVEDAATAIAKMNYVYSRVPNAEMWIEPIHTAKELYD